jgi:NADH-quinone oxidoreductase subunit M
MWELLGSFQPLSILVFFPLLGVILILCVPRKHEKIAKGIATAIALAEFIISVPLFILWKNSSTGWQLVEKYPWIEQYGISYYLGIDGTSMLLILLTTFLSLISIVSSYTAIKKREKEYYISLLLLETGMIGVFVSLDLFLFYIFWELMLIPMYLLIGVWGGERRIYAAIKFFIYTAVGSFLMLIAILSLVYYNYSVTKVITFNLDTLYALDGIPFNFQLWMFAAFALSFAIKVPMYPVHTWLPDAHTEAPTAGSIILAGVLLKMGTYGFFRFAMPLFPDATAAAIPYLSILALIGITIGALISMMQTDVKKLVAYSSVAHLGFVMLGLFSLNLQGVQGGVIQMINHGLSTGALFLLVGILYEKRHTRDIKEYGGIAKVMPVYATLFMITMLASVGLPGLNGFVGEFLILLGAFNSTTVPGIVVVISITGVIFAGGYLLWMYKRVFFGKITNEKNKTLKDVNKRELLLALSLILFMVWIGIYPKTFLEKTENSSEMMIKKVEIKPVKKAKKDPQIIKKIKGNG